MVVCSLAVTAGQSRLRACVPAATAPAFPRRPSRASPGGGESAGGRAAAMPFPTAFPGFRRRLRRVPGWGLAAHGNRAAHVRVLWPSVLCPLMLGRRAEPGARGEGQGLDAGGERGLDDRRE